MRIQFETKVQYGKILGARLTDADNPEAYVECGSDDFVFVEDVR